MLILPKTFEFPDKNPGSHPTAKEMKDEASNIAFDEQIMENNYMFVMLWN